MLLIEPKINQVFTIKNTTTKANYNVHVIEDDCKHMCVNCIFYMDGEICNTFNCSSNTRDDKKQIRFALEL
jgi:hypothetical protein